MLQPESLQTATGRAPAGGITLRSGTGVIGAAFAAAACSIALGIALSNAPSVRSASTAAAAAHHRLIARHGLSFLPAAARAPVSAAIAADDPAYLVTSTRDALRASNPAQGLHVRFTRDDAAISSGQARLGIALRAVGYGGSLHPLTPVSPTSSANRVSYAYPGLRGWYANGPLGLEQGFTIEQAPAGHNSSTFTLSLALWGNGTPSVTDGGHGMSISQSGKAVLRYTGLLATDARGRALRSWLTLHGGLLAVRVDTAGARYPLRIDPLIEREKLTGGAEQQNVGQIGGAFGFVAVSANGKTALIGAPEDNELEGAAFVFTRSGEVWTQQGPKLTGAGETSEHGFANKGFFGQSVALSADGNTALVGGPANEGLQTNAFEQGTGAVWVFTRSHAKWNEQAMLKAAAAPGASFGYTLALSSDGNTALIGGPLDNNDHGAAWVFTRSGSTWSEQAKLTGAGESGSNPEFGHAVALSADGDTALSGGDGNESLVGAAWVFTRSGSTWSEQAKLTGGGEIGKGLFGKGVALDANGNTALVGAIGDNSNTGAAWAFTRSGSVWTEQEKLTGSGESGEGFGQSIALSSDGDSALIGANQSNGDVGAAYLFTRSDEAWAEQQKLTGTGEVGPANFGVSVALSADASTAMIGGPFNEHVPPHEEAIGAAWAFTTGAPVSPTVETTAATSVTESSATANGEVNPEAITVTSCTFEYGTTTAYGSSAACMPSPGSGPSAVPVSVAMTGLASNTVYHYKIVATNVAGTSESSDETLTTPRKSATGETSEPSKPATAKSEELSAEASGGTGSVIVGQYGANPVGSPSFLSAGSYFDVSIGPGNSFTSVEFTDCELNGATFVEWWNPSGAGKWERVSDEVGPSGSPGCITVIVNATTTPSLKQLTGTVLGAAVPPGPAPTVTGLSAKTGPMGGGTVVTIAGTGFAGVSAVHFGGAAATNVHFDSPTAVTATTPPGSGKVIVTVTTPNGTSPATGKPAKKAKFKYKKEKKT
jgi:hypothetical protein